MELITFNSQWMAQVPLPPPLSPFICKVPYSLDTLCLCHVGLKGLVASADHACKHKSDSHVLFLRAKIFLLVNVDQQCANRRNMFNAHVHD